MKNIFAVMLVAMLAVSGCAGKEQKASGLLDTARFEEKQNNLEHARKLYSEIVSSYPGTEAAKTAAKRLTEIPAPK